MIRLRDIYTLPSKPVPLTSGDVRKGWFPELNSLDCLGDDQGLAELETEGRLKLHLPLHNQANGGELHYLTFDETPMLIAYSEGWDYGSTRERWVTNVDAYRNCLAYLMTKQPVPDCDDYADPDVLRFEEEVLYHMGEAVAADFGYPFEARAEGYILLPNRSKTLPSAPTDSYLLLVTAGVPEPSEFIRRGAAVLQQVRLVPREELEAQNPRVLEVNADEGRDRVYLYQSHLGDLPNAHITSI